MKDIKAGDMVEKEQKLLCLYWIIGLNLDLIK